MIIYQSSKVGFINDVDQNALAPLLQSAFLAKTGSIPSDSRVWADEYSRFSTALRNAAVEDDIQVAIEYHISAAGRFRIDVLLAGNDGTADNGVIVELKAWDTAGFSTIVEMHLYAAGGHAFGMRGSEAPITRWAELVDGWLRTIGMVGPEVRVEGDGPDSPHDPHGRARFRR